jgi:hypothetical protein
VSIGIAWDDRACKDLSIHSIRFWDEVGSDKCYNTFVKKIINPCRPKKSVLQDLKVAPYDSAGGSWFEQCLRYTVVSVAQEDQPPVTDPDGEMMYKAP